MPAAKAGAGICAQSSGLKATAPSDLRETGTPQLVLTQTLEPLNQFDGQFSARLKSSPDTEPGVGVCAIPGPRIGTWGTRPAAKAGAGICAQSSSLKATAPSDSRETGTPQLVLTQT